MKKARKLITFILAAVMIMSMSLNVWAAGETGTITISGAKKNAVYSAYQILVLESYSGAAYSYSIAPGWEEFIQEQEEKNRVKITDGKYVTWSGPDESKDDDVKAFAEDALTYVREKGIISTQAKMLTEDGSVTLEELPLGYYLVDSSMGVLCILDTTDESLLIAEKNIAPTIDKKIEIGDGEWATSNSASIGDVVKFKITITAQNGAQKYVLHDTLDSGFTFIEDSILVDGLTKSEDYTITIPGADGDGCTFEIEFTDEYLATITEQTSIVVTYNAKLNEEANTGTTTGNVNTATLEYGEAPWVDTDDDNIPDEPDSEIPNPITPPAETTTFTYSFDLVKIDEKGNLLDGAKFELYKKVSDTESIQVYLVEEEGIYIVDTSGEETNTTINVTSGKVTIKGLEEGTYFLKETEPPEGYNLLVSAKEFYLDSDLVAVFENNDYSEGGIHVVNNTGSQLPSTGGIGTTIFYIVGGVLVVFAVVLLVTKKRMKNEE